MLLKCRFLFLIPQSFLSIFLFLHLLLLITRNFPPFIYKPDILKKFPDDIYGTESLLETFYNSSILESHLVNISERYTKMASKISSKGKKLLFDYEENQIILSKEKTIEEEHINREKNNLKISVFSLITAFLSLIVAIIALMK